MYNINEKKVGDNMSIRSDMIRGHTETIILAHLMNGNSYGYEINKSIKEKTDNKYELNDATLYCAFRRLEEMGYITSFWGEGNSGARRRYYSITNEGIEFYKKNVEEWNLTKELIDKLI